MFKKVCILYLVFTLGSVAQSSDEIVTLYVGADEWCPYNCTPNTPHPGYLIELLTEAMRPYNIHIEYRLIPWQRALEMTEKGELHAAIGAVSGNAGENLLGEEVLGFDETVLVTRPEVSLSEMNIAELDRLAIGVIADYTYDNHGPIDTYLAQRKSNNNRIYTITQENPLESLFHMLDKGYIDVFPENRYVASYNIQRFGFENQFRIVETHKGDSIYIAFTPSAAGKNYLSVFDHEVKKMKRNGKFDRILSKYGLPPIH